MDTPNPYLPPVADVHDIFDATAPLELADRGTRLGAALLDGLIGGAMVYGPLFLCLIVSGFLSRTTADQSANITLIAVGALLSTVGFGIWCWLTIRGVSSNGQSIAKKMLGIKVVRADGSPAALGRIFWLRNVVNTLIGVIPVYALVDVLFIFNDERQCLHDKIADTIVVKA